MRKIEIKSRLTTLAHEVERETKGMSESKTVAVLQMRVAQEIATWPTSAMRKFNKMKQREVDEILAGSPRRG